VPELLVQRRSRRGGRRRPSPPRLRCGR
jgi:hypothetical protein